jgi:hypothetical protein
LCVLRIVGYSEGDRKNVVVVEDKKWVDVNPHSSTSKSVLLITMDTTTTIEIILKRSAGKSQERKYAISGFFEWQSYDEQW